MGKRQVRIRVLGAGREVGRSGILVTLGRHNVLLDYGVSLSGDEPGFPLHVAPRDLTAVALTHAHLDHSGAVPLLYISEQPKLLTTRLTLELSKILIYDFLKISKYYVPYESIEVETMERSALIVSPGDEVEFGDLRIRTFNAGHIPGSTMYMIEWEGTKILYTGDFNLEDTCTLSGADEAAFGDLDVIIMEATYSMFNHPERDDVERNFVDAVNEVLDGGGTVLVPAFAVGRAQEIIGVLAKYGVNAPVYVDGMARAVAETMLRHRGALRDPEFFSKAYGMASKVEGWRMRKQIVRSPCVIVSPAGMLKGGASVFYMERLLEDPKNGVFFVSYQVPDTPGRGVLSSGVFPVKNKLTEVRARVEWFDFSSHCGRRELLKVAGMARDARIVLVHVEERCGIRFKEELEQSYGAEVYLPANGEEIKIEL